MFAHPAFSPGTADRPGEAVITCGELRRSARLLGSRYEFEGYVPADQEAVLDGVFHTLTLQPGLILHAASTRDLHSLQSRNAQLRPGVKIVVVVDGLTDISFGEHRFELGSQAARTGRTHGAMVNLVEAETFSRRWQRGRHERKVSLTLTREWFEHHGLIDEPGLARFLGTHLAGRSWLLSARAIELARTILQAGSPPAGPARLRLEAHCIEMAAEAFSAAFSAPAPDDGGWREIDRRRLHRLDELLHTEDALHLSSQDIARAVGSNPTTLQVLARRAWGCSVSERARAIRMDKARTLLAQGASVAAAAEAAGFRSPGNFSTAFRLLYGQTPRQARRGRSPAGA